MLTIDSTILDPSPFEYILEQTPSTRTLDDSSVSETETVANCPTVFEYDVTMPDGSALDPAYIVSYDSATKTISVESSDRSYIPLSPLDLKLKVKYVGV